MPFDHFSWIAGIYDGIGQFIIDEPLLGCLALSPSNLLVDAGGGTGRVAIALRGMVREVVVVDVSQAMLRHATAKGLASVNGAAEALPFPTESIDRVVMVDALHHVKDQRQTISEFWRVLSPGGRIVIIELDIKKLNVKLIAIGEKLLLMRSHFLTGERIKDLFSAPGAKVDLIYDQSNVYLTAKKVNKD